MRFSFSLFFVVVVNSKKENPYFAVRAKGRKRIVTQLKCSNEIFALFEFKYVVKFVPKTYFRLHETIE